MVMYRSLPRRMLRFQNVPYSRPGMPQGAMGPNPEAPLSALYPAASTYQSIQSEPAAVIVTPNEPQQQQAVTPLPPGANPMRLALAKQMLATGSSTAPVMSPLEGLARALQGGIGGYMAGQENRTQEARDAALGGRLAELYGLDPATVEGLSAADVTAYAGSQAAQRAKEAEAEAKAAKETFGQEKNLRKEFSDLSKDFRAQRAGYQRMLASAEDPSQAGDISLVFSYMKILDPGSTVREGEFATVQNAGNVGDRLIGLYNRLLGKEGRLSDSQRRDFVNRAGMLYGGALDTHRSREKEYRDLAGQYDVNPDRVVRDYVRGLEPEEMTGTEETPEDPGQTAVDASVSGGNRPVATPETQEDFDKLPSGARYFDPDDPPGSPPRIKP